MAIIMSNKKIETSLLKPFTSVFDRVYVSTDEDTFPDNNEFQLSEKNLSKLFNLINYSWDGEIYWFSNENKEKVLDVLNKWFKDENNHLDSDDFGISNCFLMKEMVNGGLCLIDTQLDMSSNITHFLNELGLKYPDMTYECYSDCHLIDHIYLGRGSSNNEFEDLYFLYKEGIITDSFFINVFSAVDFEDEDGEYYDLLPKDKEIVITGKLPYSREQILSDLNDAGYKTGEKVTKDSWLWLGEKVGETKINQAKEKGVQCNTIAEVIEMAFKKYLDNKKKLNNTVQP